MTDQIRRRTVARKTKAERAVFRPDQPFQEGVRGDEQYLVQNQARFDRLTREYLGELDG